MNTSTQDLFFKLVRAGLWADAESTDLGIQEYTDSVDWEKVYQVAEEQSVVGLVLAGLELSNVKPPQELLLQWIGEVQVLERQNKAMNQFIAELIEKMRIADIYTILVKGQGIAQCYERPLWRSCGDVDLLLNVDNYEKAKTFLTPLADQVEPEEINMKHLGMTIGDWIVELHGTMHTEISSRVNLGVDEAQDACFKKGGVRSWNNGGTNILLPSPDNDVILVFTHILEHFFIEGVGLRQVCDWCRLLWTYRSELDLQLLESRIQNMGLMSEWKAFYALATKYLGMPDLGSQDSQARMSDQGAGLMVYDSRFDKKADRIMELVLESGNFGHNKDLSYRTRYSGITYKIVAAWRRLKDFASLIPVFPLDAPRFYVTYILGKVK